MTAWFKRKEKGIQTATEEKKDTPKGLWYKSPTGKIVESEDLAKNFYVSPEDDYHVRIGSKEYFEILFGSEPSLLFDDITASVQEFCGFVSQPFWGGFPPPPPISAYYNKET